MALTENDCQMRIIYIYIETELFTVVKEGYPCRTLKTKYISLKGGHRPVKYLLDFAKYDCTQKGSKS